jgi:tripartite-type tricarboxylate transporter receptor subunit TctC
MNTKTAIIALSFFATAAQANPTINWTNLSAPTHEWITVSHSADTGEAFAMDSGSIYATPVNTGGLVVRFILGHLISNGSTEMSSFAVDCRSGNVKEVEHGVLNRNGRLAEMDPTQGIRQVTVGSIMEEAASKVCGYAYTKMGLKASRNLGE